MPKKAKKSGQKSPKNFQNIPDLSPKKCFEEIICSIPEPEKSELKDKIESVRASLSRPKPGEFWKDPIKKLNAKLKMKAAKDSQPKIIYTLEWRSTGEYIETESLEDAAKQVGYSPNTLKNYLSKSKANEVYVTHNDDVVTVAKIKIKNNCLQANKNSL